MPSSREAPAFSIGCKLCHINGVIGELENLGWCLVPNFADTHTCTQLRSRIQTGKAQGTLTKAGIGKLADRQVITHVRGDWIQWLDRSDPFLERLEELRQDLNRQAFLGLRHLEAHLAYYPPGTQYQRHVDRFQNSPTRRVSFVLYLNRDWRAEQGGMLRLEAPQGTVDIEPREGSLLIFLSDLPHQVLQTSADRYSLTGWFRTDDPSL